MTHDNGPRRPLPSRNCHCDSRRGLRCSGLCCCTYKIVWITKISEENK